MESRIGQTYEGKVWWGFHKQKTPLTLEFPELHIFRNLEDIQDYYHFILTLFLYFLCIYYLSLSEQVIGLDELLIWLCIAVILVFSSLLICWDNFFSPLELLAREWPALWEWCTCILVSALGCLMQSGFSETSAVKIFPVLDSRLHRGFIEIWSNLCWRHISRIFFPLSNFCTRA